MSDEKDKPTTPPAKPSIPEFPKDRFEFNDIPIKPTFPSDRIEKGEKPSDISKKDD